MISNPLLRAVRPLCNSVRRSSRRRLNPQCPTSSPRPSLSSSSPPASPISFQIQNQFTRWIQATGSDAGGLSRPYKAEISGKDYETLHGELFLTIVAEPLNAFIGHRYEDWDGVREALTLAQRHFYAFWHADEAISLHGFLPFFYMGRGEVFDDLRACLLHLQDKEMENIVVRAVREIEEPKTWQLFSLLKDVLDEEGQPRNLLNDERLKSIFEPLRTLYMERREVTLQRVEELVRRHSSEFLTIR